ncbi:hypothetical protein ACC689_07850 [Rhizobium ruizarguesonis]
MTIQDTIRQIEHELAETLAEQNLECHLLNEGEFLYVFFQRPGLGRFRSCVDLMFRPDGSWDKALLEFRDNFPDPIKGSEWIYYTNGALSYADAVSASNALKEVKEVLESGDLYPSSLDAPLVANEGMLWERLRTELDIFGVNEFEISKDELEIDGEKFWRESFSFDFDGKAVTLLSPVAPDWRFEIWIDKEIRLMPEETGDAELLELFHDVLDRIPKQFR